MNTISTGTRVIAQNPVGREVEGTVVGHENGMTLVEWTGPWMMSGARQHVGRFTQVRPA